MSNKRIKSNEMVAKSKHKVVSCSTPEHQLDSPSRDSDSIYDSDTASPIPYLCTQDGTADVVWNHHGTKYDSKNTTPVRKVKRTRSKFIEKPPKRRIVRPSQKKTELLQDLIELNQNLQELLTNRPKTEKPHSEEDIFSDSCDSSPRSTLKSKDRCLRKKLMSSKFAKTEPDNIESDDSINECLIKASQIIEEEVYEPKPAKKPCLEHVGNNIKPGLNVEIDQDSMNAILSKLESPFVNKVKKYESPKIKNDSFDSLLGNLNDSAFEKLSQMPKNVKENTNWTIKDLVICGESPSTKTTFGRHNSMPESPSVIDTNKPSTSGMVFGRYSSMPFNKSDEKIKVPGDSPIRCTPDEIKRKHQLAREKLLAKRQLPFTTNSTQSQHITTSLPSQIVPNNNNNNKPVPYNNNKPVFQYKVRTNTVQKSIEPPKPSSETDIKLLIEKKRQEALMKLRRRQPQNKL